MAVYPCDYSRHRYRQPQQSLYWTEISDHLVSTYKVRLCPQHFDEVTSVIASKMDLVDDSTPSSSLCELCQAPRLMTQQARVFPAHADEVQYILDVCAACASRLGNDLHVYNGERLAAR